MDALTHAAATNGMLSLPQSVMFYQRIKNFGRSNAKITCWTDKTGSYQNT